MQNVTLRRLLAAFVAVMVLGAILFLASWGLRHAWDNRFADYPEAETTCFDASGSACQSKERTLEFIEVKTKVDFPSDSELLYSRSSATRHGDSYAVALVTFTKGTEIELPDSCQAEPSIDYTVNQRNKDMAVLKKLGYRQTISSYRCLGTKLSFAQSATTGLPLLIIDSYLTSY